MIEPHADADGDAEPRRDQDADGQGFESLGVSIDHAAVEGHLGQGLHRRAERREGDTDRDHPGDLPDHKQGHDGQETIDKRI